MLAVKMLDKHTLINIHFLANELAKTSSFIVEVKGYTIGHVTIFTTMFVLNPETNIESEVSEVHSSNM